MLNVATSTWRHTSLVTFLMLYRLTASLSSSANGLGSRPQEASLEQEVLTLALRRVNTVRDHNVCLSRGIPLHCGQVIGVTPCRVLVFVCGRYLRFDLFLSLEIDSHRHGRVSSLLWVLPCLVPEAPPAQRCPVRDAFHQKC